MAIQFGRSGSPDRPQSSQWALDAITDPAVRAKTLQWRRDWEEQTRSGGH